MEFKNKKTNQQNTLLKDFVNMSLKIEITAVMKTIVILWSANHHILEK